METETLPPIECRKSTCAGKGLFAGDFIPKDSFIFISHMKVDVQPEGHASHSTERWNTGGVQWVNVRGHDLYNHSKVKNNCRIKTELIGSKGVAVKKVYSIKDIEKGEELFADYTEDLDVEQPLPGWEE